MSGHDSWPYFLRMLFTACVIGTMGHCLIEVTTLHYRVRKLERARPVATSPAPPDINLTITIPDDWVK